MILIALNSCKENAVEQNGRMRLSYSVFIFEDPGEINHFWSTYKFNDKGLLVSRVLNDTTFLIKSNLYRPVRTVNEYQYDPQGFLTERSTFVQSTASETRSITTFSYFNGLLIREKNETREIVYNYDNGQKLINTVTTSLQSGNKTIAEYRDGVPANWQYHPQGYMLTSGNTTHYYNAALLLWRTEEKDPETEAVIYEETWDYADLLHPLASIPDWKGFPAIKSIAYRTGVEKQIRKYRKNQGSETETEKKSLNQVVNVEGLLVRNQGTEYLKMNTQDAFSRKIDLKYFYEVY